MTQRKVAIACAIAGALATTAIVALPVQAGTCVPVTVKGRAGDPATATTQAANKLTQRAAMIGGKIKGRTTDCRKGPPGGFVCVTSAVVCPQG